VLISGESPSALCEFGKSAKGRSQTIRTGATDPHLSLQGRTAVNDVGGIFMKIGPLRTLALCATCAVLAGAGSAALAADDEGPTTTGPTAGQAGRTVTMRTCVLVPAKEAGEKAGERCTVTAGDGPPPGKPHFGGCAVRVESGTGDKAAADAAIRKKMAAGAKEKCKVLSDDGPPPGGKPPFGGCMKGEPGTDEKAADEDAARAKKAAIAKEKAAAAAT
jgi:hypothetical protein